jgi:hypothetical protein
MPQHDDYEHYEFILITPRSYRYAVAAADKGYKDAQLTLTLVHKTYSALQKEPMECLCSDCRVLLDSEINRPTAFAVCIPMFPTADTDALSCAVCENCAERSDLFERMFEALREICPSATLVEAARTKQ